MSVTATNEGSICVLRVSGDCGGEAAEKLRSLAQTALDDDGRDFVVDLSEVSSINSEALEALTWLQRESENQLGMVKLCHVPDNIRQVLLVTRLNTKFELIDQMEHALASFS